MDNYQLAAVNGNEMLNIVAGRRWSCIERCVWRA
jgi:hypothetical protein